MAERAELAASAEDAVYDRDDAFRRLAEAQYERLRGLAWRFGVPASEVDDAVQDILVRAWLGWGRFRGDAAPETWLTRVAVNHLTSWRRTWLRRAQRLLPFRPRERVEPRVEANDGYARALECVGRLPERLRTVFVLRYLEEMRSAEVAEVTGTTEATVRVRAHEARRRLREMLKDMRP